VQNEDAVGWRQGLQRQLIDAGSASGVRLTEVGDFGAKNRVNILD
jgi:hypothetical protein